MSSAIPLTLVQTGRDTLEQCLSAQRWQQSQQDQLTYCYFDDHACRQYLTAHLGDRVARAFDGLRPGAFKADLFRYAFLYVQGGIYVDLDMLPVVPLQTLLDEHPRAQLISCRERPGIRGVWQGFLASVPGLAPLKWAIDRIVHYVETQYYPPPQPEVSFWEPILSLTGPVLLAQALVAHGMSAKLPHGEQKAGDLTVHLLTFDDNVREADGRLLIADACPDYVPHDSYAPLFMQRQVYQ
jgi:mannosyltransferase OCH1-like enzyme